MSHCNTNRLVAYRTLLTIGFLLIATNLRSPITGIAPVLETLQSIFIFSPAQAGLLTTLPLLAFGIISPFAAVFARKYGFERSLFVALLLIAGGVVTRSMGSAWYLYLGTAIIGAGCAIGNVLLPCLVKRDFPAKMPTIMGICSIAMGGGAALASMSAAPLESLFGWQIALGSTIIFPLIALVFWSRRLVEYSSVEKSNPATLSCSGSIWRSALAWQVTLFMGINSLLYYVLVAWLPVILTSAGLSPSLAGSLHGVMQFASAVPGLLLGPVVGRMKDQKLIAAMTGILMGIALFGLCIVPEWAVLWTFCFGVGSGGGILLALIFMSLRTDNTHQAAALSGMAQCIGYFLAACGPILADKLRDLTGNWTVALSIGVGLTAVVVIFGLLAGRSRTVDI